jgi:hypothetical protein
MSTIERTQPMRIHKNLVIKCLREHPEDLRQILGEQFATAEEAIVWLEKNPAEWIVNGVLEVPAAS